MMPLSYNGLGFTAILIMIAVLATGQGIRYLKERYGNRHHKQQP